LVLCLWGTGSELGQASSDGSITSGHQPAAGAAHFVLGHSDAVASNAGVGIHGEAMIADTAHFGAEVAYAHFTGSALGQTLPALQRLEDFEGLGFGIDQFHSISFL